MGRINFRVGMVSTLALLVVALSFGLFAQEAAEKQEQESKTKKPEPTYDWKKGAEGVWKAHITQFPGDGGEKSKPEFSVLRVTAEEYKEFRHHRREFLNHHQVFSKDVNKQATCPIASGVPVNPTGAGYYLVILHWPNSTALCTAYPIGN